MESRIVGGKKIIKIRLKKPFKIGSNRGLLSHEL